MTHTTTIPPQNTPVIGDRARKALKLTARWNDDPVSQQDRRVLVLLAAFADAGVTQPLARNLAARAGITVTELDQGLGRLAAGGLIWTIRRHGREVNRYVLLFAGDQVPAEERKRFEEYRRVREERRRARQREAVPA